MPKAHAQNHRVLRYLNYIQTGRTFAQKKVKFCFEVVMYHMVFSCNSTRDAGTRKGPGGQTLLKGTDKILIMLKSIPWNLEG